MTLQFIGIILLLIYSNFVLYDVNAGGHSYFACVDVSSFFNVSLNKYNSTIQSFAQEFTSLIHEHARVNSSQQSFDFSNYANALFFSYQNKISTTTYDLFKAIAVFIGASSLDDMANIIFGDYPPEYPLDCVKNIHDPFYAYASIDSRLNALLNEIINSHRPNP